VHLCGALLEADPESGRAVGFRRVDLWETGASPFESVGPLREEAESAVAPGDEEP
jgi:hypothetical protein